MADAANILVIEDETPVAMLMVHLLTHAGCMVEVAWNSAKALWLARNGNFDLIVLSLDLADKNGHELCRRLKEIPHLRRTPVIFISRCFSNQDQKKVLESGAADCLGKPLDAAEFIFRVISHIKAREGGSSGLWLNDADIRPADVTGLSLVSR